MYLFKDLFIYFKERRSRGGTEGERASSGRLLEEHRVWHRAQSYNPEIMISAEMESWMLNQLSHPGAQVGSLILQIRM